VGLAAEEGGGDRHHGGQGNGEGGSCDQATPPTPMALGLAAREELCSAIGLLGHPEKRSW
jgi:hypothetical protein